MTDDGGERHPVDGWAVRPFATGGAFEQWLDAHHASDPGLWVVLAKKGTAIASLSFAEALETALCFGWVDSKMQRYDDDRYLLRYQPRKPRSTWSPRNRELAERLVTEGRMRPSGLAQMEAARADGRWDAS